MISVSVDENRLIEELYLTLQLVLVIVVLNFSFPMFSQIGFTSLTGFAVLYSAYVALKIMHYTRNVYFLEQELISRPSRILTVLDGLFLGWLVYIHFQSGDNILEVFYAYVIIQGIRYKGESPWIFSALPACIHITIVTFGMDHSIFQFEHIVELGLYFILSWLVEIPFKQLSVLRDERTYYYQELHRKNEELEKMATTDYLTTLSNHQSFYTYFNALKMMSIKKNFPISLTLIDIDNFKLVNDTYGHLAGDQILKELAEVLQSNIRSSDFAARYGGEEFALVFPNTEIETSIELSERVRKSIEQHDFIVGKTRIQITVSLGTDTFKPKKESTGLYEFINQVDELLYLAKSRGKNQVQYVNSGH